MENTVFIYKNTEITFLSSNKDVLVNATEMAKPFSKLPGDWLRLKATKDYVTTFSSVKGIPISGLIHVNKGGATNQGTMLYNNIALEFARWLSPEFSIWCNDKILELLEKKSVSIINQPGAISRKDLALMVLAAEEEIERLNTINTKLQLRSDFVDKVFETSDLISMSQVAKVLELKIGRNLLFKTLREKGILFKNCNEPKQHLVQKGYFKLKEKSITRDNHPPKIVIQTFVTQLGLGFLARELGVIIPKTNKIPLLT